MSPSNCSDSNCSFSGCHGLLITCLLPCPALIMHINHLFCTVPCPFPSDIGTGLEEGIGTEQFKLHIVITKAHVKFKQDWLKIF